MENHVDQNTGMINVSAYFENENNELWPGQFVRISMQLEKIKDAIVIPSVAVQSGQNGDFVYVIENGIVKEKPVTLGISSSDLCKQIPGSLYCSTLDQVADRLREIARPGDLILTVGAGDIYRVGEKLLKERD